MLVKRDFPLTDVGAGATLKNESPQRNENMKMNTKYLFLCRNISIDTKKP